MALGRSPGSSGEATPGVDSAQAVETARAQGTPTGEENTPDLLKLASRGAGSTRSAGGTDPSWQAKARVSTLSLVLFAATAALLIGPLARDHALHYFLPAPAMAAILAAAFAITMATPIAFHSRGHSYLASLNELPLIIGLVALSPLLLVVTIVLGEGLVRGLYRRQPLTKLLFNCAEEAVAATVAVLVFRVALGTASPVSLRGWGAALLALALFALIAPLAVQSAMRLYGQTAKYEWGAELRALLLLTSASTVLAIVVLDTLWFDPKSLLPLGLVALLVVVAYRGYAHLVRRLGALDRLEHFTRVLSSEQLDLRETRRLILTEVAVVVRAEEVSLVLPGPGRNIQLAELDSTGALRVSRAELAPDGVIHEVLATGTGRLVGSRQEPPRGAQPSTTQPDPLLGDLVDAMVAPLIAKETPFGALLARGRLEDFDPFDGDDLTLFQSLAAHASIALERARLVEELQIEAIHRAHQASHDSLTGLPNRTHFLELVQRAIGESGRAAIGLFDLDRFKDVNDTLGHEVGDRLIEEIAKRLMRECAGRAQVARLGGDEFAVLVNDHVGGNEALGLVRDLHRAIGRPVHVDELTLATTASAGIALAPEHGSDAATLLQRADVAMYQGKAIGSGIVVYHEESDQHTARRLALGGHLARALERTDELSLVYQPIARTATGEVTRVEVLARWHHPQFGSVPADEFVAIAEHLGLVGRLTTFVLDAACAQAARWRLAGYNLEIAVNLSGRDIVDHGLVAQVAGTLERHHLPADLLTLELTETAVMTDLEVARQVLEDLGQLGVRLAIDDFGTGYSSLAYLHRLPVDELKIDRSFVTHLAQDYSDSVIVRSSIAMAHSLGVAVIAEGVEDAPAWKALAEMECDFIQGYYLSRPLSAEALELWLTSRPTATARESRSGVVQPLSARGSRAGRGRNETRTTPITGRVPRVSQSPEPNPERDLPDRRDRRG